MPISEPSASPSGFSWVTTISRSARAQLLEYSFAVGACAVLTHLFRIPPLVV